VLQRNIGCPRGVVVLCLTDHTALRLSAVFRRVNRDAAPSLRLQDREAIIIS
jgi:hypothetical protein